MRLGARIAIVPSGRRVPAPVKPAQSLIFVLIVIAVGSR
jgi:hypothetical protein